MAVEARSSEFGPVVEMPVMFVTLNSKETASAWAKMIERIRNIDKTALGMKLRRGQKAAIAAAVDGGAVKTLERVLRGNQFCDRKLHDLGSRIRKYFCQTQFMLGRTCRNWGRGRHMFSN